MKIIARRADSDLDAFFTAQAMESAGASVFSVTYDGVRMPLDALAPDSRFIVWAKHDESLTTDAIDDAISKALYGEQPK